MEFKHMATWFGRLRFCGWSAEPDRPGRAHVAIGAVRSTEQNRCQHLQICRFDCLCRLSQPNPCTLQHLYVLKRFAICCPAMIEGACWGIDLSLLISVAWSADEFGCGWMWMAAVMTSTRNIKKDQNGMLPKPLGTAATYLKRYLWGREQTQRDHPCIDLKDSKVPARTKTSIAFKEYVYILHTHTIYVSNLLTYIGHSNCELCSTSRHAVLNTKVVLVLETQKSRILLALSLDFFVCA